ncbi:amidase domain-containing protein [Agromyces binzhouensis]|uniref:CHAP domain-containing protein n=1 Tax=Agromyces binzhouensis TaxID=1817495 RepID=A0A4Q2JRZ7_9MICO|nr:amidase domain-containing protein [Agromyces binzhouensis]RXZ49736.1 CHAP domain-containing protein [Agromyces binzhouensis]
MATLIGVTALGTICLVGCAGVPPLPPQVASADSASPTRSGEPDFEDGDDGDAEGDGTGSDVAEADADLVADRTSDPAVLAQLDYALAYWSDYNIEEWGVLEGNDCVNFASQALVARGWEQTDEWHHGGDPYSSTASWRSSTAMHAWLSAHPELATPLDDGDRDQVRLGDIVQFDWDRSGDRDHTGIVTRIERGDGEVRIAFAGHTKDSAYRDVDVAITEEHPGAEVYYWRLAG